MRFICKQVKRFPETKKNRLENNGSTYAIYAENSTGIISVKMPTKSRSPESQ